MSRLPSVHRRSTGRRVAIVVTVLVLAGGAAATAIVLSGATDGDDAAGTVDGSLDAVDGSAGAGSEIETALVTRGDLTAEDDFRGTVGFGAQWELGLGTGHTVTASHPIGTIVEFGQPLVVLDEVPVLLVRGDVPMYRDLELTSPNLTGSDVVQLQQMLIDAGFDRDGRLEVDGTFGNTTRRAVLDWQEATGRPETGRITTSDIVFSPVPLRVADDLRVGTSASTLPVTEWEPAVTVDIANRDRTLLPVGAEVSVELDGGTTVGGTVTAHETVAADDGSTSTRVTITPDEVPGDAATARIVVTNTVADDVVLVPVGALLALAEGGYAVEVVTRDGAATVTTDLVPVEVGAILDGRAEVTGELEPDTEIVVAT